MNKYHFRINNSVTYKNAASKAVNDCRNILIKNNYTDLEINFNKSALLLPYNFLKLFFYLIKYLFIVKKKSLIFIQYPLLGINGIFKFYAKLLKIKGCVFACIIHDIEALRSINPTAAAKSEMEAISTYNAVIAHNTAMKQWLIQNGYNGFIAEIDLFDYLLSEKQSTDTKQNNEYQNKNVTVAYAGNLGTFGRSPFLKILRQDKIDFTLNLYGPGYETNLAVNKNINWCGSYSSEEIVDVINGDYGLIWDGDSLQTISGMMGDYLKYNTPHKTSLYLAAGIPIIVSNQAAIAELVKSENIGICINSLSDIVMEVNKVKIETYLRFKENALQISLKLKAGYFFESALIKIENFLL